MPRPKFIPNSEIPYHVGSRVINKAPYPIPLDRVWQIMIYQLWETYIKYDLNIHTFVLMPNHFHLIATTPRANLDKAMAYFKCMTTKAINTECGRINNLHGDRYFNSLLISQHYYLQCYKYVYRNPVKAGLCEKVEEYPYSTIRSFLGLSKITLPLLPDNTLMSDIDGCLAWLNQPTEDKSWQMIKRALHRKKFKFSPSPDRAQNPLENKLI